LPSALLKEFSECTDEEMDCALSGSAMQAIPTTNNAAVLILQADRDNLRMCRYQHLNHYQTLQEFTATTR
jgi:hypothetical protein